MRLLRSDKMWVDPQVISAYRNALMGIAAIWVLAIHALDCGVVLPGILSPVAKVMSYGQAGVTMFLVLSGMGCFFSLQKSDNVCLFYRKRLVRLYQVYIIFVLLNIVENLLLHQPIELRNVLWHFTAIGYWFGKGSVPWFVAMILLAYLLMPWYYKLFCHFGQKWYVPLITIVVTTLVGTVLLCFDINPLGEKIVRLTDCIVGFQFGAYIQQKKKIHVGLIVTAGMVIVAKSFFVWKDNSIVVAYSLLGMAVFVCFAVGVIFQTMSEFMKSPIALLGQMGMISLESYLWNDYLMKLTHHVNWFAGLNANITYLLILGAGIGLSVLTHLLVSKVRKS